MKTFCSSSPTVVMFTVTVVIFMTALFAFVSPTLLVVSAHRCIHDEEIAPFLRSVAPPQTLPQHYVQDALEDGAAHGRPRRREALPEAASPQPVRFNTSFLDLYNATKYCSFVGQNAPTFKGGTLTCAAEDILTTEKRDALINVLLPEALRRISTLLSVIPLTQPITGLHSSICPLYIIPEDHTTNGVNNTDVVLYVSAGPTPLGNVAWAGMCATDNTGRPIVGRVNFGPRYIKWSTPEEVDSFVRTAIHELFHMMGFSFDVFENGFNVPNGTSAISYQVVRNGLNATLLSSPRVVAEGRKFYNCSTLSGVELEDEGPAGTKLSHWERRSTYEEVMVGVEGILDRISVLTLATFEDTGYYWPNYSAAETMEFGNNTGCAFLTEVCTSPLLSPRAQTMFCDGGAQPNRQMCSYDFKVVGLCSMKNQTTDITPSYFRYYPSNDKLGGNVQLMDFCPFVSRSPAFFCPRGNASTGTANEKILGYTFGASSRCLYAATLIEQFYVTPTDDYSRCLGVKCFYTNCTGGSGFPFGCDYILQIQVRDTGFQWCPLDGSAGQIVAPSGFTGSISCPVANTICKPGSPGYGDDLIFEEFTTTTTSPPTSTTTSVTPPPPTTTTTATSTTGGGSGTTTSAAASSTTITTETASASSTPITTTTIAATTTNTLTTIFNASTLAPTATSSGVTASSVVGTSTTAGAGGTSTTTTMMMGGSSSSSTTSAAPSGPTTTTDMNGSTDAPLTTSVAAATTTTVDPNGGGSGSLTGDITPGVCFLANLPCYVSYIIGGVAILFVAMILTWLFKKFFIGKDDGKKDNQPPPHLRANNKPAFNAAGAAAAIGASAGAGGNGALAGNKYAQLNQEMKHMSKEEIASSFGVSPPAAAIPAGGGAGAGMPVRSPGLGPLSSPGHNYIAPEMQQLSPRANPMELGVGGPRQPQPFFIDDDL